MFKLRKYRRWMGVFLSVVLLISAMAPAVFAETDDNAAQPCTLTENCTLEAGHTGDCVTDDASETAPICAQLPGCTEDGHAPECPLYVAGETDDDLDAGDTGESEPVCAQLPECTEESHAETCPLYVPESTDAEADSESAGQTLALNAAVPLSEGTGFSVDDPMVVPEENMVIVGGTYYGIQKDWFARVNPEQETMYFSVTIPNTVTAIAEDGFKDSYRSDKQNNGAVTYNDKIGRYNIVAIDFSNATGLTTIKSQAASGCKYLTGVLDLSNTKLAIIEKTAFRDCEGLTGVILPGTLEVLGEADGSSGSVFSGCSGLQFVRTSGGDPEAAFELPDTLKAIGSQTFKNTFPKGSDLKIRIPASVENVGSEAFASNSAFSQIYIERKSDYDGYDSGAFKAAATKDSLLIFPSNTAYNETGSFRRITKTYPVTLQFMNDGDMIAEQVKLYKQSIQYTQDDQGLWYIDENYTLPNTDGLPSVPGYDAGWQVYGGTEVLTNTAVVDGWPDAALKVTLVNTDVVSKPTVEYTVNGNVVDKEKGVQHLTVQMDENHPGSVGVKVTHPLASEEARESGTYVYFDYCWWDESGENDSVNGPRSEEEPELFSSANNSGDFNRVHTDQASIPIRDRFDARTDGDYYMVEVYGYYVQDNGTPKQFYKSNHNFIGSAQDGNAGEGFVMEVDVEDLTPVTVTPADITIYTGGEGHDGIVDENGDIVSGNLENGFPEPGYYITLPESLNALLGGDTEAVNLADQLTFRYDDGNDTMREWKVELYGTTENSTDIEIDGDARARYIYRLLPSTNEQIPVRLEITDPETGESVLNDMFNLTMEEKYREYEMSIYSGLLEQSLVTAKLVIGEDVYNIPVEVSPGKLTVRGLNEETASNIVSSEDAVTGNQITALAPEGVTYYVNGSNVEVVDTDAVKLLVDTVISEDVLTEYIESNMSDKLPEGEYGYVQQYMDLVDTANGNAYLTLGDGQSMTIYWPVPEDYSEGGDALIFHFDALDRNYDGTVDAVLENDPPQVIETTVTEIGGRQYFKFDTASFSPFVLLYEKIPTKYTLTVENGSGDGQYTAGEQVTITADTAPSGKVFDHWELTVGGGTLEDAYSATTVFTMPGNDATVTAVYKNDSGGTVDPEPEKDYALVVENGSGDGRYKAGEQVTITADKAPEGKVFDKWVTSNGGTFADAASATTTFTMPGNDVTVTATYKDASTIPSEPSDPDESEPSEPDDPTDPDDSDTSSDPNESGTSSTPDDSDTSGEDVPRTGDNSQPVLWLLVMGLSCVGLGTTIVKIKKKELR